MSRPLASAFLVFCVVPVFAGEADVLDVEVSCDSNSVCRFDVTVKHDDAGWSHYANRWDVVGPDGEVLGSRELLHPHDDEQDDGEQGERGEETGHRMLTGRGSVGRLLQHRSDLLHFQHQRRPGRRLQPRWSR